MRDRLKHFNMGAALPLHDDDIAIVEHIPPSKGLHRIRAIISTNGAVEKAEYWIQRGMDTSFGHWRFSLPPEDVQAIRSELSSLGDYFANFSPDTVEPGTEEAGQRVVRFWRGRNRVAAMLLIPALQRDRDAQACFERTWLCIQSLLERAQKAEPVAPPNGGPAEPLGNSGVGGGPPSVS
jgi:hypothetical protein